ncbi:MAG: glycosyltransferase [Phycisphaerae bacterium]|nr:glycosyltransferase [Phycisphaerae bacterium]
MRVLMLGWEFPPFISGGLGTACHGLTKAMSRQGTEVIFVLPKSVHGQQADHVRLLSPQAVTAPDAQSPGGGPPGIETYEMDEMEGVVFKSVPSRITSPYLPPDQRREELARQLAEARAAEATAEEELDDDELPGEGGAAGGDDYSGDVVAEAQRYARICRRLARRETFDVIHAHDWMTYPAGLAVARQSGRPLVVHVHSTEYDRSGENVHQGIYEIERRGMHGAMRVVCVSHLTRKICVHRYGVAPDKVEVVYNGIESNGPTSPRGQIEKGDKIVLFLGRITMQKGPEYFLGAARKVLEKIDNVKFVMAGSGDMVPQINRMATEMGIAKKVLFTGFLRGRDVERVFDMADVYVMPSVSEPFGIAPLEAIRHDVPVIISRNSGVAEVLQHALKVDFWDTEEMANKIIAVLRHPPLSQTLREHADLEVRNLTWDGAAIKCDQVYRRAMEDMHQPPVPTH